MGRDERPRSSAWVWGVAGAWGRRGWLKPYPPEGGFGRDVETHPVNLVHPVCFSSLLDRIYRIEEDLSHARLTLHAASALKPRRRQGRGGNGALRIKWEDQPRNTRKPRKRRGFNIALRAYALRLWLRAQTPQLRFGNILSMVNLLFAPAKRLWPEGL